VKVAAEFARDKDKIDYARQLLILLAPYRTTMNKRYFYLSIK
jgi:hypothetical protein